jgi:uncharacterized protein
MAKLTKEEKRVWESLCLQCGKCCYAKYHLGILVIVDPEKPCKYLDNNKCSVYNERFKVNPSCKKVLSYALFVNGILPRECRYIQLKEGYIPSIFPKDIDHFWEIVRSIEEALQKTNYEFEYNGKKVAASDLDLKMYVTHMREKHGG